MSENQHHPASDQQSDRPSDRSSRRGPWVAALAAVIAMGAATPVIIAAMRSGEDSQAVPRQSGSSGATQGDSGSGRAVPPASPTKPPLVDPSNPTTPATPRPSSTPSGNVPDGHTACPNSVAGQANTWVPAAPFGALTGALVPAEAPSAAIICRYAVDNVGSEINAEPYSGINQPSGGVLWGRQVVSAGMAGLTADLLTAPKESSAPRACTQIGGGRTAYLVALEYAGGVVWVRSDIEPNFCEGSTNGTFASSTSISHQLAASFAAQHWVSAGDLNTKPVSDGCPTRSIRGQVGQDTSLAPGAPTKVTICGMPPYAKDGVVSSTDAPVKPVVQSLSPEQAAPVLAALRSAAVARTMGWCQQPENATTVPASYDVILDYAHGGSVTIHVSPGCTPSVLGPDLQAADSSAVVAAIRSVTTGMP